MLRSATMLSAFVMTGIASAVPAADFFYCTDRQRPVQPAMALSDEFGPVTAPQIDPAAYFDRLVERYRKLHFYKDSSRIVQVTNRDGCESNRTETQINCEIADGKLKLITPASQLRDQLGLDLPIKIGKPASETGSAYNLWLAPHMAMKFTDKPLKQLRAGVDEGFTPKSVEPVTINNKPMMHVELRSGEEGSESDTAKFDLYVNSDSMLIERIEGEQKLPDGASYSTTVHITPHEDASSDTEPAKTQALAPVAPREPEAPVPPHTGPGESEPALPAKAPMDSAPRN
jgi:hypothetical protein